MEQVKIRSRSILILMGCCRLMPLMMSSRVYGVAHGVCQPKRNGGNFKSIVFGHGLTITINQVLQDMWSRPRAVMLHFFCLLQVAVMRARLTRRAYMATTGRARFSKVPLIVAPLISCSSFGLVSKAIGITHAIMVLLCVAYAIHNQQQVWATRNQIASYTLLVAKSIVMSIAVSMIFTDVI
ncbi:MAG: hypothetical protein EGR33_03465 [Prevotella sp.]|nr:hypothetical protein [Prevotella sp.]